MEPKIITLKTSDNFEIIGDYYATLAKNAPAAMLVHMMPATRESWKIFAKKLNEIGFQCLAIDLRGHGDSQGGPKGFQNFSDEEHQASAYDIKSAIDYFIKKGTTLEKISLIGASIGANLALQFQSRHPEIKSSALLSPGLDYHGIAAERGIKNLNYDQSIFLVAGGENDAYSTETANKLYALARSQNKRLKIFKNAGHGTTIFKEEPSFMDELVLWLKSIYF